MTYTVGKVRFLLQNWQTRAHGARIKVREDRLGSPPPPLDEAPFAPSTREWADMDRALNNLSAGRHEMVFMEVCLGGSSWCHMKPYNWREKIGDWYGTTGGSVNQLVGQAIQEMVDYLNGTAVDNGVDSVTVLA